MWQRGLDSKRKEHYFCSGLYSTESPCSVPLDLHANSLEIRVISLQIRVISLEI